MSVVPELLEVTAFMAISIAEVKLDARGLVFIEGENQDDTTAVSNGAGKSSLVDAISWCLYGITARGVTGDAVINRQEGKGTEVALNIRVDGDLWRVERGRKHKTLKNRVRLLKMDSGNWVDHTLGTDKLTQERIDSLLGCNAKTFNEAVYMGQENMPDLPAMTDKALKSTLEQALNLDRLDEATAIANIRLENAANRHASLRRQIENKEREYNATEATMTALSARVRDLSAEIDDLTVEIKTQEDSVGAAITELKKKIKAAEANEAVLHEAYRAAVAAQADADNQPEIRRLNSEALDANHLVRVSAEAHEQLRDELRALELEARAAESLTCPTCGKSDDHSEEESVTLARNEKMEALKAKAAKVLLRHADLKEKETIARTNVIEAKALARTKVSETLVESNIANAAASALRAEMTRLKSTSTTGVITMRRWLEEKVEQRGKANTMMDKHGKELNELERNMNDMHEDANEAEARAQVLEKVKHVLSRKGFRGEVLDQVTPYLNARTQYYLTWLTADNISAVWNTVYQTSSGDLAENFHIKVAHKDGAEVFEGLSGGEKRKVRLACAMALQDLVGTRASKPIKLFIADEIDDAIDDAGLELLMGLLEEKAKSVGTLLIISHNSLGDWCKESITMVKKDGMTTIK